MTDQRSAVDWQEANARLERVRRALEEHAEPAPEQVARVLKERALALARAPQAAASPEESHDVLVFGLGAERYAIALAAVEALVAPGELTWVPGLPAAYRGVANHRGRVVAMIDLRGLLTSTSEVAVAAACSAVMVEWADASFGILVDSVHGVAAMSLHGLAAAPADSGRGLIQGVTPDLIAVVDVDALVRRLVIDEPAAVPGAPGGER